MTTRDYKVLPNPDGPKPSPLPAWRLKRPWSSEWVLGFLLTDEVAVRACEKRGESVEDSEHKASDYHTIHRWVVQDLARKHPMPARFIHSPALVFEDRTRASMEFCVALVDLRSFRRSERGPPSVELVEEIADELQLKGKARVPRWYLLADLD
ncbi:hypothetical protein GLOTRDRAFT_91417 [Gloeophyllum trabeum ATCC 11539]|uniref:Uncharacterized protein n=1 Tax=Gloeophyllum trabeum (strain ATCC 11539 / FP-39264 / Madison 617) TaxID=670483 RepID=S7QES9_GLOTA|nr:uncharacterized protein GLOTRDRAFT_91417 [Gloeophyllum trabeum ATCC 11539]EPQ57808.1 hypothetical protein GLOTRDRAFT_91417 [Gloeophyllum trabeum ATCC 11539]